MKASTAAAAGAVLALACRPSMPLHELRRLWWVLVLAPRDQTTEAALVAVSMRAAAPKEDRP